MEQAIICEYEYDKKVNFALQQSHVPVIKYLTIKNASSESFTKIKIEIKANPSFSEPHMITIDELYAGEIVEFRHPDLVLSSEFLSSLDESMSGHLQIVVSSEDQEVYREYLPVDVLSFDSWPGSSLLPEIISSYITPNRPYIMDIIKRASNIMQKNTKSNAMDGYQSGDPNRVLAQLSAIFTAIQSDGIAYANPPASFERDGQKIRFPDTIKQHRLGTCLDLTLLYAACAEAIGIYPLIVFVRGHAFPAFWLMERSLSESFQDDKSILTKHMASGINEMIVVESTLLTDQNASFNSAVLSAKQSLDKPDYFHYFIDVHRSRIGQIKPISLRVSDGEKIQAAPQTEEPVKINENFSFEKVEIIPEDDRPSDTSSQHEKITYWKNQLIDMTLRNSLLNFRINSQGIPLVTPNLAKTEDVLAMGEKVYIETLPNELRSKIREFGNQAELLHSDLLQTDLKNKRLRSTLTEMSLEKELVNLYRRAKNDLEESGANSLFVALGFLKWFDPKSPWQERFAPILLLPVNLVRLSAKQGYYIRVRDEEIQINISLIEYLKQNFSIDASRLYDIPKDEHGADVKKVLTTLRRIIMPMKKWDVYNRASIGIFSFSKFVMWNDLENHADELMKNKVVKSLMEGHYIGEIDESMNTDLTTEKDEEEKYFTPLSSDRTQMEAILAAGNNNSFVLHGPPGSGKSQTIANMISQALATGKTVLFVAEKMAALSVVQSRLTDIGLENFCLEVYSNKGQKRDILAQLETSFEIQHKTKGTNWEEKSDEISNLKKELNKYVTDLHTPTSLGINIFEMIESYSSLDSPGKLISFDRQQVIDMDELKFRKSKQAIEKLTVAGRACGDLGTNPWANIKQTAYSLKLHDMLKEKLTAITSKTVKLPKLPKMLDKLGITNEDKRHEWYEFIHVLIPALQDIPMINLNLLAVDNFEQIKGIVLEVITSGKKRDESREELNKRFDKSILKLDVETLLQELRLADNSWFLKKLIGRNKVSNELKKYFIGKGKVESSELEMILLAVKDTKEQQLFLDGHKELMELYFSESWNDSEGKWDEILKAINWIDSVYTLIKEINSSESFVKDLAPKFEDNKQVLKGTELKEEMEIYQDAYTDVMDHWKIVADELLSPNFHEPQQTGWVNFSVKKATKLIDALPQLKDNCHLALMVEEAESLDLENVTTPYLEGQIEHKDLYSTYLYSFYRIRIDEEITGSEVLSTFTKASFENKLKKFNELDDEISELTQLEVYVRLMQNVPDLMNNVIQSSEPGILMRAIRSGGRGIAIRQLFERTRNLLPKIKPCMLMSPLSVAQYIGPTFPKFDLVIFDEASQLPTSEAIGAMARGENVIVVGDPKQLPPTNFFNAQQAEADFELQDLESVLDDCLAIRLPQKHLEWHYRSEHESLISFSNNHFYENKLITFPSIDDTVSRVSFKNVQGIYDRGKTRQNKVEAESIVEEVFTRLNDPLRSDESIGIVTFSQVQQTLIEDLIDERLKKETSLERYFSDEVPEPVFVKNLENVQGDERDIILFSIGYGPDQLGHMTLNFGPLNREGGWRRLNVAVSRAKKEMIIVASMEPDQINLSRTKAEGVHSLRAFMEFAKRGNEPLLSENHKRKEQPNSTVIIPRIKETLEKHGYDVIENVGSSEFKIDLAVVNPKNEDQYLAAIQVDGHQYANRITTRDRNKLTDIILERLGWWVIKVWSIEWWHSEEKQIERIIMRLKEIEEKIAKEGQEKSIASDNNKKKSIQELIGNLVIHEEDNKENQDYYNRVILENVDFPNDTFYTHEGRIIISKQIQQVIDVEAPISFSELTRRIIEAWGFSRSGANIERTIKNSMTMGTLYITTEEKGEFLWKNEEQYKNYTKFRVMNDYRREPQDISVIEYANGVMNIMKTALRLPKIDLVREVLRKQGYSRIGNLGEQCVQEAIALNVEHELIVEDSEGNIEKVK